MYVNSSSNFNRDYWEEDLPELGKYDFTPPIKIKVQVNTDGCILCCDEGQFYEEGASRWDVLNKLEETLDHVWKKFVESDAGNMNEGAIAYKKWLETRIRKR